MRHTYTRGIALLLTLAMLMSLLPAVFAAQEEPPVKGTQTKAIATTELENGTWNIDHSYRQLRPQLTKGGLLEIYRRDLLQQDQQVRATATSFLPHPDLPRASCLSAP
ncbi:MAG: hypothetical protein E7467_03005 [Ruminococcaceae bacterium]|nr:hypothetical protein [Oscillospiraceae bacterium]